MGARSLLRERMVAAPFPCDRGETTVRRRGGAGADRVRSGSHRERASCHANCAAMPSRRLTCGSHPSSSSLTSVAPPLRLASPACAGWSSMTTCPGELADHVDESVQRDLAPAGDVHDGAGPTVGLGGAEVGGDDVGDVGELADLRRRRRSAGTARR